MNRCDGGKQSCWIISDFLREIGSIIPEVHELGRAGVRNLRKNEKFDSQPRTLGKWIN